MATQTGTLVLMGSGETTPTMVTTHQKLITATAARVGRQPRAALLDTPYGFQENAEEITEKARQYFSHNVGHPVDLVSAPAPAQASGLDVEQALDAIRGLDWLFAGPGSPTYAARQWTSHPFTEAFAGVVTRGGTLVLSSAAAVTAGTRTVPVYEVYKAGQPVGWADGLGVVEALTGWRCAVIPHFDNAEGGTHDTRYCYLGARRLEAMEAELDPGEWVLGIDEHTAAIFDLSAGTMSVEGRGAVHVRRDGQPVASFGPGEPVPMSALTDAEGAGTVAVDPSPDGGVEDGDGPRQTPMQEQVAELQATFDRALEQEDAAAATAAALEVESLIRDWAADTVDSDDTDRAVTALRGMITRLGRLAGAGMHDHRELVRPHVETLLHVRDDARAKKVFEIADHIRGHMDADGVRVKDTREGTTWEWDDPVDR